jgi:hypothetical protein
LSAKKPWIWIQIRINVYRNAESGSALNLVRMVSQYKSRIRNLDSDSELESENPDRIINICGTQNKCRSVHSAIFLTVSGHFAKREGSDSLGYFGSGRVSRQLELPQLFRNIEKVQKGCNPRIVLPLHVHFPITSCVEERSIFVCYLRCFLSFRFPARGKLSLPRRLRRQR